MARATVWLLHPNTLFREGLKRILVDAPFELTLEGAGLQAVLDHQAYVPRSARRLCRVRDEHPKRASDGGNREGEGQRCL